MCCPWRGRACKRGGKRMDIQLRYMEKGAGFPLILLHGNGEDHTYFEHQMGPFGARYRVIAVDTRGHGASPRGTAPFFAPRPQGLCALRPADGQGSSSAPAFMVVGPVTVTAPCRLKRPLSSTKAIVLPPSISTVRSSTA